MHKHHLPPVASALLVAAALIAAPLPGTGAAHAQSKGPGWFIPPQAQPAAPRPAARAAAAPAAREQVVPPPPAPVAPPGPLPDLANLPQLPVPTLPTLSKGTAPPVAVVGVLGVPEVMRASSAAQQVQKVIGARRDQLNHDAQTEQTAWRDLQQALVNERPHLSPAVVRARERALQERINTAQITFRDRNTIIQEAAQVALSQIERTLVAVIRQVAESRGMNLVLHRAQIALNVNAFDITQEVADELDRVLPSVQIPPDGMPAAKFLASLKVPVEPPPAAGPTVAKAAAAKAAAEAAAAKSAATSAPPKK
ncbi:MAG TPA: OmpH family outer membrane protein [Acetobacteraceae bacterium]|nr:OmpH family outer membrane protein [Acetobacteraceae bacterium]